MVATSIIYIIITVSNFKVLLRLLNNGVNISILIFLFIYGLLVGFIFINYISNFSNFDYRELTY